MVALPLVASVLTPEEGHKPLVMQTDLECSQVGIRLHTECENHGI